MSSSMRPSRPLKVKELVAQAENFTFTPNIPLKSWVQSFERIGLEATFALREGDYGKAYVMLYRQTVLVVKYLPTHPEAKTPAGKTMLKPLLDSGMRLLGDLETLKPEIQGAVDEWQRMRPALPDRTTPPSRYDNYAERDPSLSGNAKILDAAENQDLAVNLAKEELTRRDTARQARKPGTSDPGRRQGGRWEDWETRGSIWDDAVLQRQMEATRRTLTSPRETRQDELQPTSQHYSYPAIARSQPVRMDSPGPPLPERNASPALPPKEATPDSVYATRPPPPIPPSGRPPLPEKIPERASTQPSLDLAELVPAQPALPPKQSASVPPLPQKERLTFKPGGYLENGDPIRSLFIPTQLRDSFLKIASKNTAAGLEMCGILCGSPVNNAIFIRCLLIPDQKCTSDTCETVNESAVFDYCIGEDLMMIGWIHTHPTQTCFMSSRDLHTHAGYQVMMPESVAIVCSPRYEPSYGIFRLTNPPGLDHILNCNHTETFHQHVVDNLYREAEHPSGHVYESEKLPFYVHDLRPKA